MFSKKLDCECNHAYIDHTDDPFGSQCKNCKCSYYDPVGHNPEQENFLCPQCRLTWMNRLDERSYFCYACGYIMFEKQVKELIG